MNKLDFSQSSHVLDKDNFHLDNVFNNTIFQKYFAVNHILIVCMGNICRSPMAHAILQKLTIDEQRVSRLKVDSVGTHTHPSGDRPDPRARAMLARHGFNAGSFRSRKICMQDFQNFDLILAMDHQNLLELKRLCPLEHQHKLHLFLSFAAGLDEVVVPDPYYGNEMGFERVFELCLAGAKGLRQHYCL